MAEEEKKTNWFKFGFKVIVLAIVIFVILAIIFVILDLNIAGVSMRERMYNIYDKTISPGIAYAKINIGFMAPFFKGADIILGGKAEAYTLEEKAEVREETGVSIDLLKPFGLSYGNEFGVSTNLIAYKFDPNIENVDAFLSCNVKDKIGNIFPGEIKSPRITNINGKDGVKIPNYKDREKKEIPFRCVFKRDINFDEGNLYLNLAYEFSPRVELEVFALGKEFAEEYMDKYDLAFQELEKDEKGKGKYNNYKSKVPSSMKYVTDVKAIINFDYQPLIINKENLLIFRFENGNKENKIELKGFNLNLPDGINFKVCSYFNGNSGEVKLSEEYLKVFSEDLNSDGVSEEFVCYVNVDGAILGGSGGELIKANSINAELIYDTKLEKKMAIKLERISEV